MNNNGWKSWVIGALLGILLGGGGSALFGQVQAYQVEKRLNAKIAKLAEREEKAYEIILSMAERMVRMETQLENIEKRLEDR